MPKATSTKTPSRSKPCIDGTQAHHFVIEPTDGSSLGAECTRGCGVAKTWLKAPVLDWSLPGSPVQLGKGTVDYDRRLAEER